MIHLLYIYIYIFLYLIGGPFISNLVSTVTKVFIRLSVQAYFSFVFIVLTSPAKQFHFMYITFLPGYKVVVLNGKNFINKSF
jgi:hypothetical protein